MKRCRRGREQFSTSSRRLAWLGASAGVQPGLRRNSPVNALSFGMICRDEAHRSQNPRQAALSGRRSWPIATSVPYTKLVRSSRFLLVRIERLKTRLPQNWAAGVILQYSGPQPVRLAESALVFPKPPVRIDLPFRSFTKAASFLPGKIVANGTAVLFPLAQKPLPLFQVDSKPRQAGGEIARWPHESAQKRTKKKLSAD